MPKIRRIHESQAQLPFRREKGSLWSFVGVWEKRAIMGLGSLTILVSVFYVYFVMASVMHVAEREELAVAASKLSGEVAKLENEYLKKTEGITESYALEKGFVEISKRSFITKTSNVAVRSE